jgi:serine/threonine-protein kinase
VLGNAHPDVGMSLQQLAGLQVYLGNVPAAQAFQLQAVDVLRAAGRDSVLVDVLERLGAILWRRGDDAGAESAFREAIAISQRVFPVSHQYRLGATMRLANFLKEFPSRRAEAESLGMAAVRESRAGFGDEHVVTASNMKQLGDMLVAHGKQAEGVQLIRQALAIEQRVFGPTHEVAAVTTVELAVALKHNGYSAEGERLAREALPMLAKSLGTNHSMYAGTLGYLADYAALRGALDSAEALYRRAIAIRAKSLGPQQALTALTEAGLAGVLTKQRRFAEADSLYRSTLAVLRRQTTDTHLDVRLTYSGMATLYDAWGKPDSAAIFRRLAEPASSSAR